MIVNVADSVTVPACPEIEAVAFAATGRVPTVVLALLDPPGIMRLEATIALPLDDISVTFTPPEGAGAFRPTVRLLLTPPITVEGAS